LFAQYLRRGTHVLHPEVVIAVPRIERRDPPPAVDRQQINERGFAQLGVNADALARPQGHDAGVLDAQKPAVFFPFQGCEIDV
jgi:hypothetical protein